MAQVINLKKENTIITWLLRLSVDLLEHYVYSSPIFGIQTQHLIVAKWGTILHQDMQKILGLDCYPYSRICERMSCEESAIFCKYCIYSHEGQNHLIFLTILNKN